jgi:glutamate carboxypeptidase
MTYSHMDNSTLPSALRGFTSEFGKGSGGGTDAAFAGLNSKAAILEGMGLSGDGAHSNNAEYILVESIVPRLYLATKLIMDLSTAQK